MTAQDIRKILNLNGIQISDLKWETLEAWGKLLLETNQQINLISRKATADFWEKQVLHSLALLAVFEIPANATVCDFGSGGGLPGIPLAILRPDLQVTLLDSKQKKTNALNRMKTELRIPNLQVVGGRGEELGKKKRWKQNFSVITARAVAPLWQLEQWTRDLRAPESVLYTYKGGDLKQERHALAGITQTVSVQQTRLALKGYSGFLEEEKSILALRFL